MLGCGPAYAQAVAEYALGLALDLARGISREDRAFRAGQERWVADGNADAILLRHADVGFLGYGNLGRAAHRLLAPFGPRLRVFDPWLPDSVLRDAGRHARLLDEVLASSTFPCSSSPPSPRTASGCSTPPVSTSCARAHA